MKEIIKQAFNTEFGVVGYLCDDGKVYIKVSERVMDKLEASEFLEGLSSPKHKQDILNLFDSFAEYFSKQ